MILFGLSSLILSIIFFSYYKSDNFNIIQESIFIHHVPISTNLVYTHTKNNYYLINQNVAQYSSYIVTEKSNVGTIYKMIVHIKLNTKKIKDYGTKSNFNCVVKFKISEKYNYIALEVFEEHRFATKNNRKFLFLFLLKIH